MAWKRTKQDVRAMTDAEMIKRMKAMKFNEPDIENLRKHASEAREKALKFAEETKRSSMISEKTLHMHFTI